jgi:hypothetical protein
MALRWTRIVSINHFLSFLVIEVGAGGIDLTWTKGPLSRCTARCAGMQGVTRRDSREAKQSSPGRSLGQRLRQGLFPTSLRLQYELHDLACGTLSSRPAGREMANRG